MLTCTWLHLLAHALVSASRQVASNTRKGSFWQSSLPVAIPACCRAGLSVVTALPVAAFSNSCVQSTSSTVGPPPGAPLPGAPPGMPPGMPPASAPPAPAAISAVSTCQSSAVTR